MAGDHVRHLVREHRGELGGVVGERDQPARDVERPGRQREGVDRRRIEHRHLVAQIRPLRGRHELRHGVVDQGLQPGVFIDAAIGRKDALVLALGGGRLGLRLQLGRLRQRHLALDQGGARAAGKAESERKHEPRPKPRLPAGGGTARGGHRALAAGGHADRSAWACRQRRRIRALRIRSAPARRPQSPDRCALRSCRGRAAAALQMFVGQARRRRRPLPAGARSSPSGPPTSGVRN